MDFGGKTQQHSHCYSSQYQKQAIMPQLRPNLYGKPSRNIFVMKVPLPGSGKLVYNIPLGSNSDLANNASVAPPWLVAFIAIFGALDCGSYWVFFHTPLELAVIYHRLIGM